MNPAIRRASADDADFIAWTILTAQRGHRPRGWFDIALTLPEAECAAFVRHVAVAPIVSQWHVSHFWIAEDDGIAVAALCALSIGEARTTVRSAIEAAALETGVSAAELAEIWRRGSYAGKCWSWGDDGNWMIEHVAVLPTHRGRGLVQLLLDHALRYGQADGFSRASIGFYVGNVPAERCYSKAGFSFAEEKRDADFEALTGAPGFRRFERAI